MHFSTLDVKLGTNWTGEFVATSNTASIEVNTNLFDFSVPGTQPGPGRFAFHFHMIDVPAFYVRPYSLRVIARNGAGERVEEDVPFRISERAQP